MSQGFCGFLLVWVVGGGGGGGGGCGEGAGCMAGGGSGFRCFIFVRINE